MTRCSLAMSGARICSSAIRRSTCWTKRSAPGCSTESIKTRLFTLPDHVEVYPGHYGGSACGGINMSGKVSSTIYFEKRFNQAMQQPDADAFARFVKETAKPFPGNYAGIKSRNLGLTAEAEAAV